MSRYTRKEREKRNARQTKTRGLFEWCEELIVAAIYVVLLFTFIFRAVTVRGPSMLPNLQEGNRLFIATIHRPLRLGDIIVVTNVQEEPIIKRVIATAGQQVDINYTTGVVTVDGKELDDTAFGLERNCTTPTNFGYDAIQFPITVPKGCVFVLGDNRSVSLDSRYESIGVIDHRNILGKVILRISPLTEFGLL